METGHGLHYIFFPDARLPDADDLSALAPTGHWTREGDSGEELTCFDTFDWRLYAAGFAAEELHIGAEVMFQVRKFGGSEAPISQSGPAPRLAIDHPELPCNARLIPVVEMRALLPMVQLRIVRHSWALRDGNGKIVLRLHHERLKFNRVEEGAAAGDLQLLRLEPLKGYPEACARVREIYSVRSGLTPQETDPYDLVLQQLKLPPEVVSAKKTVPLTPRLSIFDALRCILRQQLTAMIRNEAGARIGLDSEFLHDFRVAVRRTRTLLGQVKGVFPAKIEQKFRREFAWLGQITGPTRDLDVYLLDFPLYQAALPVQYRPDLAPLHDFLLQQQKKAQRLLTRRLQSRRYQVLLEEWRTWLECPSPADMSLGPKAQLPVREVADRRIWKIYSRVIREGEAIGPDSPAAELHELRKSCKKLRYLLEFFASLYPEKQIRQLISALKKLQDNIGAYHDLAVQSAALRDDSLRMADTEDVPVATQLAMGMLIEQLLVRQQQTRQLFSERFAGFAGQRTRQQLVELCQR